MCAVVEDIYYVLRGPGGRIRDARCCGVKSRDEVRLGESRVVLGEGLKDINGERYRGDLLWTRFSNTTAHD